MVANDQAYDSHSAQGMQLDNNVFYSAKESGGTRRNILGLGTDNNLYVGYDHSGHTIIHAGSSKLVKMQTLRQDDTTNSYPDNNVFLYGWGWKLGTAATTMSEAVTFGVTFTSAPVVLLTDLGFIDGSDPNSVDDFNGGANARVKLNTTSISTTGFTTWFARISNDGNAPGDFSGTARYGYAWLAIGDYDTA